MSTPAEQHYRDVFGESVVLADEARAIILEKHPETADFIDGISDVLLHPAEVRRSARDERVVLYYQSHVTQLTISTNSSKRALACLVSLLPSP